MDSPLNETIEQRARALAVAIAMKARADAGEGMKTDAAQLARLEAIVLDAARQALLGERRCERCRMRFNEVGGGHGPRHCRDRCGKTVAEHVKGVLAKYPGLAVTSGHESTMAPHDPRSLQERMDDLVV